MTQREYTILYNQWDHSADGQRIRAYLRKCGADEDTANECWHLALSDYLMYVDAGREIAKPAYWMGTNTWHKFLRTRRPIKPVASPTADTDASPEASNEEDGVAPIFGSLVEVAVFDAPIEEVLDQPVAWALRQLSERHREVLRLSVDADPPLSEEEIAQKMGITKGTMVQYRFDARQRIRDLLEQIGYGYLLPKRRTRQR